MSHRRAVYAVGVVLLAATTGIGCSGASHRDDRAGYYSQNQYATSQYQDHGGATYYRDDRGTTRHEEKWDRCDERRASRPADCDRQARSTYDEHLASRVKKTLDQDKRTRDLDVDANARGGVVTLTGHVDHDRQKRHAGEIAKTVKGVKRIRNEIQVGSSATRYER